MISVSELPIDTMRGALSARAAGAASVAAAAINAVRRPTWTGVIFLPSFAGEVSA